MTFTPAIRAECIKRHADGKALCERAGSKPCANCVRGEIIDADIDQEAERYGGDWHQGYFALLIARSRFTTPTNTGDARLSQKEGM